MTLKWQSSKLTNGSSMSQVNFHCLRLVIRQFFQLKMDTNHQAFHNNWKIWFSFYVTPKSYVIHTGSCLWLIPEKRWNMLIEKRVYKLPLTSPYLWRIIVLRVWTCQARAVVWMRQSFRVMYYNCLSALVLSSVIPQS